MSSSVDIDTLFLEKVAVSGVFADRDHTAEANINVREPLVLILLIV